MYLLKSDKDKGFYIGYSSDLRAKIKDHTQGLARVAKNRKPLKLICYESYEDKIAVQEQKKKLKQFGSAYRVIIL